MMTIPSSTQEERQLAILEQKLNHIYQFKNKLIALQALQTIVSPAQPERMTQIIPDNKRLAILGDILLDLNMCMQWFWTGESRKKYSDTRNTIVSNKNLAEVGRRRGLDKCVNRRQDAIQSIGDKGMATTVEAIIGAVFLDAETELKGDGMEAVSKVASELGLNFTPKNN